MTGKKKRTVKAFLGVCLVAGVGLVSGIFMSMSNRSDLIQVGRPAPDFTADASDGSTVHLADLHDRKRVVLVFYPGDNTPVCTAQLCALRDSWSALKTEQAVVYGINPAPRVKHLEFARKNALPFPLLADTKGEIARAYGCRALFGIVKRTVYVLDRQGQVVWVERGNPAPGEILKALRALHDFAHVQPSTPRR